MNLRFISNRWNCGTQIRPVRVNWTIGSKAQERQTLPTISIAVEEGMEDVVPGYLEKRRAEIPVYRRALQAADFEAISRLAHKMKGTGTGYGFEKLTELGAALETVAKDSDAPATAKYLDELALYLESVELRYPNSPG